MNCGRQTLYLLPAYRIASACKDISESKVACQTYSPWMTRFPCLHHASWRYDSDTRMATPPCSVTDTLDPRCSESHRAYHRSFQPGAKTWTPLRRFSSCTDKRAPAISSARTQKNLVLPLRINGHEALAGEHRIHNCRYSTQLGLDRIRHVPCR